MASADLKEELECSICLNIYTDPITLICGHNFCQDCISRVLDSQERSGGYSCPDCREEFQDRPALRRNITLRNIVDNFLSQQPDQESGVFCTYCIHTAVPAVKSCLLCEASLCDNHLRVHSKSPEHVLCGPTTSLENRKCLSPEHVLCGPTTSLQNRKCSVHKKILEYYCIEDLTCICASCRLDGDHRGHRVEPLDEAFQMKKRKLGNALQKLITEKEKTEKSLQSLQERRRKLEGKAKDETKRVTVLFRDLRRRLEDLEKRVLSEISGQAERVSLSLSDKIQQLGIKKDELYSKVCYLKELCSTGDPLTVIQESDTGYLCDTEDGYDDKLLHDGDLDVAGISHMLHTELSEIMSGVKVQKCTDTHVYPHSSTKEIFPLVAKQSRKRPQPTSTIQHSHLQAGGPKIGAVQQTLGVSGFADILLDVSTASNYLDISDDRKTVYRASYKIFPETPESFRCSQVLSSQSFSSGRHYWEVDVGESQIWKVGMCYPSMDRRGFQSGLGYNKKSWCLERRRYNQYSFLHDNNQVPLPEGVFSNRVRIYLDYEAGRISFYDVCDPIRHLHTFTTTFTEPLHAGLRVGKDSCIKISRRESEGRNMHRDW